MKFSIIHPTRSRPQQSMHTINKFISDFNDDGDELEVIVSCDQDDPILNQYVAAYGKLMYSNKNRSAVDAVNNGAVVSTGDILLVVSDDTLSTLGWNKGILAAVGSNTDWILKTQDGIQRWIITNPIMDRVYYNRFGYIYHPAYKHMFCDTELTCVADMIGRKRTSDMLLKHNHYSVTGKPADYVTVRADSTWNQGETTFLNRYKKNFDLPLKDLKGKIQDGGMINYLQQKRAR